MKTLITFILLFLPTVSQATFLSSANISNFLLSNSGDGFIAFRFDSVPADMCEFYLWHVKFDSSTIAGQNLLQVIRSAQENSDTINIWYEASSAPGTNHGSGCTEANMATLQGIAVYTKYEPGSLSASNKPDSHESSKPDLKLHELKIFDKKNR